MPRIREKNAWIMDTIIIVIVTLICIVCLYPML